MRWQKLGRVYVASGRHGWDHSHATCPTPLVLPEGAVRVIFAAADSEGVSRLGYVDLDPSDLLKIVNVGSDPSLDIGEDGTFDDNGINPVSLVECDGRLRLYYTGFQRHRKIPYTLFSGVADSTDCGATFRRLQRVPVLDRSDSELYFRTAPCVMRVGDEWHAWYVAGDQWITTPRGAKPVYAVRRAVSADGVNWPAAGKLCMAPDLEKGEIGFGRPFVLAEDGIFKMWYSVRRDWGYTISYAESGDGLAWTERSEKVGIGVSASGWDSEMLCFGSILDIDSGRYMLYNGNGYGRTGFGVAVLDE